MRPDDHGVSSYRYQTKRSDESLTNALGELAREKLRLENRRLHVLLRRTGRPVSHKRVHRAYREAGAEPTAEEAQTLRAGGSAAAGLDCREPAVGALDLVHDAVDCGRAIRVLSVVDAYTRECSALEVDTSFASQRVTRVLDAIVAERGQPLAIRCDKSKLRWVAVLILRKFYY